MKNTLKALAILGLLTGGTAVFAADYPIIISKGPSPQVFTVDGGVLSCPDVEIKHDSKKPTVNCTLHIKSEVDITDIKNEPPKLGQKITLKSSEGQIGAFAKIEGGKVMLSNPFNQAGVNNGTTPPTLNLP